MEGKLNQAIVDGIRYAFYGWCQQAVIEGYREMLKDSTAQFSEWEEENLSARLIDESAKLKWVKRFQISILPEIRLYDPDILSGTKKARSAKRIDFRFSKWYGEIDSVYYAEAKNLYFTNIGKRDASLSKRYYVSDGIERFASGSYPAGFMLGYILHGDVEDVVNDLNSVLTKRNINPNIGLIGSKSTLHSHPFCYSSVNQTSNGILELKHIFLKF